MPDITHIVQAIFFEWDIRKALINVRKHRLSFELACEAFFDPFLHIVDEEEYVDDELREKIIGMTADWRLLYVV